MCVLLVQRVLKSDAYIDWVGRKFFRVALIAQLVERLASLLVIWCQIRTSRVRNPSHAVNFHSC